MHVYARVSQSIFGPSQPQRHRTVNSYEGFQSNGAVVLRDRRSTTKAEIPDVDLKSEGFGGDPLAICKPTGAEAVSPTKAMANFNGWTCRGQRDSERSRKHPIPSLPSHR
jgi:hypothetical protein